MKISGSPSLGTQVKLGTADTAPADRTAASAAPASGSPLQSAPLQQAQAALAELPEIDQAKVAALREALARGELPFDAGKLAGLIERYHGSRS